MKICFTIKRLEDMAGGAERVFALIANSFSERGYDISIISFDRPGAQSFYPLHQDIKWTQIPIGNSALPATVSEFIKRMSEMRRVLSQMKPDVVISFMHSSFIPTAFATIGLNLPIIGSEHIVAAHYKNRPLDFLLYAISSLFLKKITVLSEAVKSEFPALLRKKMVVISNPVAASASVDQGDVKRSNTILAVGRLDVQKDHKTLIAAFGLIAAEFPDWNLQIVGDGPLRQPLQEQIDALHLSDRVSLLHATKNIAPLYQAASIFVIPSLYESFGMVTVEAMMAGLPCIGFADCPGTNEIIRDHTTGYLVAGSDRTGSLAASLKALITQPEVRAALGASGLKEARKYSVSPIVDQWQSLVNEVTSP